MKTSVNSDKNGDSTTHPNKRKRRQDTPERESDDPSGDGSTRSLPVAGEFNLFANLLPYTDCI